MQFAAILRFIRLRVGTFSFRQRSKSHEEVDIYDYVFSIDTSSGAESGSLADSRMELHFGDGEHRDKGTLLVAMKLLASRQSWREGKRREKGL